MSRTVVWLRNDLRIADNPALYHAAAQGEVIPVYIVDTSSKKRPIGGAVQWWLHHSLCSLQKSLKAIGADLVLKKGNPKNILLDIAKKHQISQVYWNRRYSFEDIEQDKEIKTALKENDIGCESFNGSLLYEPWEIQTQKGEFFKVFTPFWKKCLTQKPREVLPEPKKISYYSGCKGENLTNLELLPHSPNWAQGIEKYWTPGENQAYQKLDEFCSNALNSYNEDRNFPAIKGTSELSPYLRFGEISPHIIWERLQILLNSLVSHTNINSAECFLSELGWREFSYHLLYHCPELPTQPFREAFSHFSWQEDAAALKKWQKGRTGIPIVDAGMRQLWETGYMHNRVRMIVASFLTKHLLLEWQKGEAWFWDTLVDADVANNAASWQWVAGCGADAAPYFRIFNPVLQSERYDPEGEYIKRWIPELGKLDKKYIHKPWEAKESYLRSCNVVLGENYPRPMIDLAFGRNRALDLYSKCIKKD